MTDLVGVLVDAYVAAPANLRAAGLSMSPAAITYLREQVAAAVPEPGREALTTSTIKYVFQEV